MIFVEAELARLLTDLFLMALAILVLVHAATRREFVRPLYPLTGLIFIGAGTVIFVFCFVDGLFETYDVGAIFGNEPGAWGGMMPEQLSWSLTRFAILLVLTGLGLGTAHRKRLEQAVTATKGRVEDAQDIVVQSEARFRYLFETTSNSIYCYAFDPPMPISLPLDEQVRRSHDAILTECNQVFAEALEAAEPADVIGTRMGILDGNKDAEAHFDFFSAFVQNDYRLTDYDLIYKTPQGEERAVRSSLTGIVKDGLLHRVWGAESNILDLRRTQAALSRRRRFQNLLTDISSSLLLSQAEEADVVVEGCVERVCRYAGADRMSIFWLNPDGTAAPAAYSWGLTDYPNRPALEFREYPHLARKIRDAEVVRVDDVEAIPEEMRADRELLQESNVKSFVAIPLIVGGDLVGVATLAHRISKRNWSDQDINELRVLSDLFANYIYRLKSRRALDEALAGLQRATDRLEAENVYLRQEIELTQGFDEIIGQSDGVLHCLHLVEMVADTLTPVLILGETGTGKELIARAIHEHSERRDRPLVKVNCAALPANLIESELFGYEKGAFTGADKTKRGRFDLADGSTLFLDEIGDIPLELQAKLLRALQEGEIERLGGSKTIKVDVRIVVATNRNLHEAVSNGEFRSDLFYRINTFPIELPPLRAREDDIQLLSEHFVKVHSQNLGRDVRAISAEMMQQMRDYDWPGNVRELESVIQRALISSSGPILKLAESLPAKKGTGRGDRPRVLSSTVADLSLVEREHILSVLEEVEWKISGDSGAAARLGIPPSTLRSKMKRLSIVRPH